MAHFAKLDENNIVLEVVVVNNDVILDENNNENEQKGIDFLKNITGHEKWKQTSYNHNFRNCYAGWGYSYDEQNDRFIEPKLFNSWILVNELVNDKPRWFYKNPVDFPSIFTYGNNIPYRITWNEEQLCWLGYDDSNPPNEFKWDPNTSSWLSTGK